MLGGGRPERKQSCSCPQGVPSLVGGTQDPGHHEAGGEGTLIPVLGLTVPGYPKSCPSSSIPKTIPAAFLKFGPMQWSGHPLQVPKT